MITFWQQLTRRDMSDDTFTKNFNYNLLDGMENVVYTAKSEILN